MRIFIYILITCLFSGTIFAQNVQRHSCQEHKQQEHFNALAGKTEADNSRSDTIDIQHYEINLTIDKDNQQLSGSTKIFFTSQMDNISQLLLDLEGLNVNYVFLNGFGTSHTHQGSLITVDLIPTLNAGQTAVVEVFYEGSPSPVAAFGGFYFSGQYAYNLGVGIGVDPPNYGRVWFPCFDNFVEHSTYEFFITTNTADKAFCNGNLEGVEDNGNGTQTWHWLMNQEIPTYLASVAVAPYETVAYTHPGLEKDIPVQLGALPGDVADMNASMIHLPETIDAFEDAFGAFQFDRVGYVIVPFFGGAMEHATNIAYPSFAIDGSLDWESLMAHEFAHHWWGDLMTCETAGDMWLNEGWASYCEHIFNEQVYGQAAYRQSIRENHEYVLQYTHHIDGGAFPLSPVPFDVTYGSHSYDKGADVAHALRGYMGDELFFECTKAFLAEYAFSNANSYQFRDFLSNCSSKDMSPFFDGWVFNSGFPHFSIDSVVVNSSGVDAFEGSLYIRQRLYNAPDFFDAVPLEISFFDPDLELHTYSVEASGACTQIDFTLPFYPLHAFVDLDEKISDATTDSYQNISTAGTYPVPEAKMSVTINSMDGDIFARMEHNWVMPDRFQNPDDFPNIILSGSRYWKVDLLSTGAFQAEAEFEYNGSTNTNGGYLDHNLITVSENNLRLFYRPSPAQDWVLAAGYNVMTQGSANDKRGTISLSNLLNGEYVLGILDPNSTDNLSTFVPDDCTTTTVITGIDELNEVESANFKIFPNPASDVVHINWEGSDKIQNIRLIDTKGSEIKTWSSSSTDRSVKLSLRGLSTGSYLLKIETESGMTRSRKLIIR